ncbi:hypothetical protein ACJJTC_015011 [Scirpophaga incertulas]
MCSINSPTSQADLEETLPGDAHSGSAGYILAEVARCLQVGRATERGTGVKSPRSSPFGGLVTIGRLPHDGLPPGKHPAEDLGCGAISLGRSVYWPGVIGAIKSLVSSP